MKTYKGWEKSNLNLDEYLIEPCQIDERMLMYLAEVVSPQYCFRADNNNFLVQTGEANDEFAGIPYHSTCLETNGKYFYLGILPQFKQPKTR